jgi:REP element-mobilizing transposase RayT
MARPLRIIFPGAFYHITARGNERKAIFKSKRDCEKFLEYLETASERYHAVIHAFCMMDNHYHLLLETPSGNLSQIMRHINGAYTTYFNVKRARSGHLFQGRYKAILVERDEYAKELSRYIHLNPVRAKRVEAPEDYLWSSYNFYIGKKKSPEWLRREFILDYFGSKASASEKEYRKFVQSLLGQQYDNPLRDVVGLVLLGSQDFINFIKQKFISSREPDKDLPTLRQLVPRVSMEVVFAEVDAVFVQAPAFSRNLKIYLCHRYTGEKLKSIGNHFGISESAVSHAASRAREQIELDRKLKKRVLTIEKKLRIASDPIDSRSFVI